ncbi:MAG: DNA polymerase III subunit [Candidatus Latescibacterota bacterium]
MFERVSGQENAKRVLSSMVESERMPHTLLFTGPYGTGKGETAFELARMLLCENGPASGCSSCRACVRASRMEHPDLHVLFPFRSKPESKDKENDWLEELFAHRKLLAEESYPTVVYEKGRQIIRFLVDEVRERLLESSLEGGRKVCVILGADRLNPTTGNALLKILEEPPEGVHFIMTTERVSSVLPTIVSRASVVRFRRLKASEIAERLERHADISPERRLVCAQLAEGSVKTAKAFAYERKDDQREQSFTLYERSARGGLETAVSNAAPLMWSKELLDAEELITGFALYTRTVLEWKCGIAPRERSRSETVRALAQSTDLASLRKLSIRLEEGLEMLGRNVNIAFIMTKLLYEIHDTYRQ